MPRTDTKRMTPDEAQRALYIDFEGRKDRPPVLLGTTHKASAHRVHAYLTDRRYDAFAVEGWDVMSFADAVDHILQRAKAKDRLIVAWTTHERDVVERWAPEHLERFDARFRNALAIAKYWRTTCHDGDKPEKGNLVNYLDLIEYTVPEAAGPGRAAETIQRIDAAFDAGKTPDRLTANQRQRWVDLLAHNAHDCAGMRAVCLKAAEEVDRRVTRLRAAAG